MLSVRAVGPLGWVWHFINYAGNGGERSAKKHMDTSMNAIWRSCFRMQPWLLYLSTASHTLFWEMIQFTKITSPLHMPINSDQQCSPIVLWKFGWILMSWMSSETVSWQSLSWMFHRSCLEVLSLAAIVGHVDTSFNSKWSTLSAAHMSPLALCLLANSREQGSLLIEVKSRWQPQGCTLCQCCGDEESAIQLHSCMFPCTFVSCSHERFQFNAATKKVDIRKQPRSIFKPYWTACAMKHLQGVHVQLHASLLTLQV